MTQETSEDKVKRIRISCIKINSFPDIFLALEFNHSELCESRISYEKHVTKSHDLIRIFFLQKILLCALGRLH